MHAGMDVPPWRTGTHLQQSYTQHEVMDTVSIAKRLDLQLQRYQSAACACGECGEAATRSETVAMEVLQYCQATVAADQVRPHSSAQPVAFGSDNAGRCTSRTTDCFSCCRFPRVRAQKAAVPWTTFWV